MQHQKTKIFFAPQFSWWCAVSNRWFRQSWEIGMSGNSKYRTKHKCIYIFKKCRNFRFSNVAWSQTRSCTFENLTLHFPTRNISFVCLFPPAAAGQKEEKICPACLRGREERICSACQISIQKGCDNSGETLRVEQPTRELHSFFYFFFFFSL